MYGIQDPIVKEMMKRCTNITHEVITDTDRVVSPSSVYEPNLDHFCYKRVTHFEIHHEYCSNHLNENNKQHSCTTLRRGIRRTLQKHGIFESES